MPVPLLEKYRIGRYILAQRRRGIRRYPLVLMLEPLFRCNLACAGCGKIRQSEAALDRQLSAGDCFRAAEECGAPVVSIAGGESLIHPEMPQIVSGLVKKKKFVYLCTNGLLLKRELGNFSPSPYLAFSIHLDGPRELHDRMAGRSGVFDAAAASMGPLRDKGFRFIVNCTIYRGATASMMSGFFDFVSSSGAEGITVSPGFSFECASDSELFLNRLGSKQLFREILKQGKNKKWKFNHSTMFIDFLAGNQSYQCTPWGSVTRNIHGWQKPCYLFAEGYARSFRELMEQTQWGNYGPERHRQCAQCMLHSGFEPTAVSDMMSHPLKALSVYLRGPVLDGPFAPEPAASGRN